MQNKKTHQLNDYLANIIRYSPGYLYLKNTDFQYILCNENFAKVAGLSSADQISGKTDYDLAWSKTHADLFRQSDLEALAGVKKINFEEPQFQADGQTKIVLANKIPLYDSNNEIIGILGNYLDISEQKQLEADLKASKIQAEAANQAKTEFLENMRHDIRTPLTGIVGFADLIKMEAHNSHIKEYAGNLVASSHALLDLMDEVLEAIRVSSGEIPLLKKKFNLERSLNQVIELNRAKAAQKKLNLSLHFDKSIPQYVIGDKVRIHRVVLELIANALNFTDTGYVTLSAELAQRKDRTLIIKIIVEDSGIGIPKDKQQDIYVQFKRLTPSYQGIYKGTGLGLTVVKQFIDELDGEIYVNSEPAKGTCFTCIIPFKEPLLNDNLGADEDLDMPKNMVDKPCIKPLKYETTETVNPQFRILIVEDNPIAQVVAKSILNQLHCTTELAATGKKAIELWNNDEFDLIFMDIGLPDFDGYEVTHQIRIQELAKKKHIPIIALTAHASDDNKQRCIKAGMNAVLTKPLTIKSCTDVLNSFLPGYNQKQVGAVAHSNELPKQEKALFQLSKFSILDVEEGIKTTSNERLLAEMLRFMVTDSLPKDLEQMKKAHAARDWDKTQQLAHKIKGGAVYVGTIKIKMACQYLERYWKSGQHALLEPLYQQTIEVIEESIEEIGHWLSKRDVN